jgi:class 3 adenylate cyclase
MPRKKPRKKKAGMPIPTIGEIEVFVMIVDMNGFTAMVRKAQRQDSIAQFVRDCLGLAIGFVEEEGGEVASFMGDAFLGVLPDARSAIHASFAIAHGLDEQCEWISNIQRESKDAWGCALGGPSIKIAIECGRVEVSTIYSRLLGEQRLLIGDAINYAARISKAPLQGNRCLVGPKAAKTEFSDYGLIGPHRVPEDPKPGEPSYEYFIFKMSDVWVEGARTAGETTYWG